MAETSKAYQRRLESGFFDKYVKGKIIDIGVGRIDTYDGADPLTPDCDTWDKDNGDAHYMTGIADETYDTVYTSHLLEHLEKPVTAIQNWWRILKKGGHLIICVPHRDLYERKKTLPSKWNADHKFFILPYECEPPNTFSMSGILNNALGVDNYYSFGLRNDDKWLIKEFLTCDTSNNHDKQHEHANGEYQIEVVIKKL